MIAAIGDDLDDKPRTSSRGARAWSVLAEKVPWFEAGIVLILGIAWTVVFQNLKGLDPGVQIFSVSVLLVVSVYFGWLMQLRFRTWSRSEHKFVSSKELDRLEGPTASAEEYKKQLREATSPKVTSAQEKP